MFVDNNTKQEMAQIIAQGYNNLGIFCRVLFPNIFSIDFSLLHDQILSAIDSPHKKIAIAAPRGLGKTSIVRGAVMRAILMRDSSFIAYVSNSETSAMLQTNNIKHDLRTTPLVRKVFGDIKDTDISDDELSGNADDFSKKMWVAFGSTVVLPRGMGQQIRGLNWRSNRPSLIIVDDLEEALSLDNPTNRDRINNWFHSDLIKAVPQHANADYKIIYIDTIKHSGSLLEELLEMDSWHGIRLSICTENYKTLAPEFKSQEELDVEVAEARKHHKLDIFARENMSIAISKENTAFKSEFFRYYDETDPKFLKQLANCFTVVIVDPAKTANLKNAESAIVAISVNIETHAIYIRYVEGEHYHPDELYKNIFAIATQYNAKMVAIEKTGLNEFITQPITNYMISQGFWFDLIWLDARRGEGEFSGPHGGKIGRIASLIPFYRQGVIRHNEQTCGKLESQLLPFPKAKKVDISDATAYIVEIMERYYQYFEPKRTTETEEEERQRIEQEYAELAEDDLEPLENWASV